LATWQSYYLSIAYRISSSGPNDKVGFFKGLAIYKAIFFPFSPEYPLVYSLSKDNGWTEEVNTAPLTE